MTTSLMYYVNLLTGFIALVKANEPWVKAGECGGLSP
jgi:hypothetical protein